MAYRRYMYRMLWAPWVGPQMREEKKGKGNIVCHNRPSRCVQTDLATKCPRDFLTANKCFRQLWHLTVQGKRPSLWTFVVFRGGLKRPRGITFPESKNWHKLVKGSRNVWTRGMKIVGKISWKDLTFDTVWLAMVHTTFYPSQDLFVYSR